MNSSLDPVDAQISVYAVATAHELGMEVEMLKRVRQMAETGEMDDDMEIREIVDVATTFCTWEEIETDDQSRSRWYEQALMSYSIKVVDALENVSPLIQPMNG